MTRGRGAARITALVAVLLLALLVTAGCAGSTIAQSPSTLVRARPTTAPETYSLQVSGAVTVLQDALDKLGALLAAPHYLDDTWKSNAVNLATMVELAYRQLEGLSPPDEQQAKYAEAVAAVRDCQTLTVYVFQGITNLDKGPFDEVTKRVDACRNRLEAATGSRGLGVEVARPVSTAVAPKEVQVRVKRDANLRGGPGTNYPVVATAATGDQFTVTGRTATGDWIQISGGSVKDAWIAVFLVEAIGDLTTIAPIAVPAMPGAAAENLPVGTPTGAP